MKDTNDTFTLDLFGEAAPPPQAVVTPPAGSLDCEINKARMIMLLRDLGRCDEITTDGAVDFRKLNRVANALRGLPASDRPAPTTEEWETIAVTVAGQHGLRFNANILRWETMPCPAR